MRFLRNNWHRHGTDRSGVVTFELAFLAAIFASLTVAMVDFGLAFVQKTGMNNAVRAGAQFALVRHPSLGPSADASASIVSIQDIRQAVVESSDLYDSDPGTPLNVCVYYQCPGESPSICTPSGGGGTTPPCGTWETYLRIDLNGEYTPIFNYPGIGSAVSLTASQTIRLN